MRLLAPRIPLKERMFFVEHLAVMLKASIPIDQALESLKEQTRRKPFRKILEDLTRTIQKGQPLSEALKHHEKVFGALFINMIEAGEYSGKLEDALKRLYTQMKRDYDIRSKVKSALAYPIFVIAAMIGIGSVVMLFVVPRLLTLFEGFEAQLPLPTRILIASSKFLSAYAFWILIALIICVGVFVRLIRGPWRERWHIILLHVPGIGTLLKRMALARFSRTLSTLLATDVLVVDALAISSRTIGYEPYARALRDASQKITRGISIAESIQPFPFLFPATVHTMVRVGEESGTLSDLLEEVARFYEESVDEMARSITSLIEPLLIVMLGVAVGGMALAILTPMFTLIQQL